MDADDSKPADYWLDEQIGYLLRLASQRHAVIFQNHVPKGLTPTQFSTLIRLSEHGAVSQNHLGRLAAMDVATTKGVVDRLRAKSLVHSHSDPTDKRRSIISLTPEGAALVETLSHLGQEISDQTLSPLKPSERRMLLAILEKIS